MKDVKQKEKKGVFKSFLEILNKRWLQKGITTLILILIIFIIYMVVTILLDKYTLPEFDLTEQKIYSLSDETKTKISKINKPVKITLINYGTDEYYQNRIDTIKKYTTLNKLITMEQIDDLSKRTDLMQKYSLETTDMLMVVESEGQEKLLSEYDLYTYDFSTYEQVDLTEEALTNAIINITAEKKPVIYFMSNHVMYDMQSFYSLANELKNDANEIKSVDLLIQGSVPEDCDCLVITTLSTDITETERDRIIDYINKGGKLLFLCGTNFTDTKLDNFQSVLAQYGVALGNGIVLEGSLDNMLAETPNAIVEDFQNKSIANKINTGLKACLFNATNITTDEQKMEELGVEHEELMCTSEKAFVRTNLSINQLSRTSSDSEEGSQIVALSATKTIDENTKSKMIIYGNDLFATDMAVAVEGKQYSAVGFYSNLDIVANSIEYLNERDNNIIIRKNLDAVSYTVTAKQNYIIMAIIFAVPVIIIIIGIIVWQIRRRKR